MADDKKPASDLSEQISKDKAKNQGFQRARGLESSKREIQRENINPTGEKNKDFDRKLFDKNMDKRELKLQKKTSRNIQLTDPKEVSTINKKDQKGIMAKASSMVVKGAKTAGKWLVRRIPFVGTAITAKEVYDYRNEIKDVLIDAVTSKEQLPQLKEENFERIPDPPQLEPPEDVSNIPVNENERILHAMNEIENYSFQDEPINLVDMDNEKVLAVMNDLEGPIDQGEPIDFTNIDNEKIMLAMNGFEEEDLPPFLRRLEDPAFQPLVMDIGAPAFDGGDSSDGGDGGADGGGDGGE